MYLSKNDRLRIIGPAYTHWCAPYSPSIFPPESTRRHFFKRFFTCTFTPNFSHSDRSSNLSIYSTLRYVRFIFPPRIFNGCLWRLVEIWMLLMQGLSRQQKQRIGFSSFCFVLNCIHFIYSFVRFEWIKIYSFESYFFCCLRLLFRLCTYVHFEHGFLFDEFSYTQSVLPFRIASLFSFIVDYNT